MKKIFANPEIEIKGFELENILTISAVAGNADENVNAQNAAIALNVGDINDNDWVTSTFFN